MKYTIKPKKIENFERNLEKIIGKTQNDLLPQNTLSQDRYINEEASARQKNLFIPFINERDRTGKLIQTRNSLQRTTSLYNSGTKNLKTEISNISMGRENIKGYNKFERRLFKLFVDVNEKSFGQEKRQVKESPCFLSPSREHFLKFQV